PERLSAARSLREAVSPPGGAEAWSHGSRATVAAHPRSRRAGTRMSQAAGARCGVSARGRHSRRFVGRSAGGRVHSSTHDRRSLEMDTTLEDAERTVKTQLTKLRWAIGI